MASLQNRRALVFGVFIILLFSCKSIESDENYNSIITLITKDKTIQYHNFMVVSPFLCKGCVEDKFMEYANNADIDLINKTVIIMDTTLKEIYHILDPNIHPIIHVPSSTIDKAFPKIANVCIFKKDTKRDVFVQKVVNADDSALVYYLQN